MSKKPLKKARYYLVPALQLYRTRALSLLVVSFLLSLFVAIIRYDLLGFSATDEVNAMLALRAVVGGLLYTLAIYLFMGMLVYLASCAEKEISIVQSFNECVSKLEHIIIAMLLSIIMVMVGTIFFIIPGFYLMVSLSMAIPSLIIGHEKGFAAISNSMALVKGRWWYTFLTYFALTVIPVGVLTVILILSQKFLPVYAYEAIFIFGKTITMPYFVIVMVLLFRELEGVVDSHDNQ